MRQRRVIEITVETRQITITRRRRPARAWCGACAAVVEMVTAEQAAEVAGTSERAVYREAEQGRFHFTETARGQLRLCLNSVLQVSGLAVGAAPEAVEEKQIGAGRLLALPKP
jgi:prophage DNA circulation protein